jgi:hypothetical protein
LVRRRTRRGQQGWHIWFKLFKLALVLGALAAISFYAFEAGQRLALEDVGNLRAEIDRMSAAETAHHDQVAKLTTDLTEAKTRADDFQARYEQVAPSDDIKEITALVRSRMAAGLDTKRLAFVIQQAEKPRRCGDVSTKRFMVRTSKYDGDATWVRFADLITVTAVGNGGENGADQWFDPEKPVTVHFTAIGGKDTQVEGKLPLQHSMVVKNGEYRFTVAPGARGFVEVTGDRCEYRN